MIRLPDEPPREDVLEQLRVWQCELDDVPDYAERVRSAVQRWKAANRDSDATFAAVRSALRNMAGGAERCCYCEDSLAA